MKETIEEKVFSIQLLNKTDENQISFIRFEMFLPYEVLCNVFSFLSDEEDKFRFSLVNKLYNNIFLYKINFDSRAVLYYSRKDMIDCLEKVLKSNYIETENDKHLLINISRF